MITEREAPVPPKAHEGLPLRERRMAMMTLLCATFMAVLDGSIANVALPTIARDLHASPALSIWVINGFQVAVCISVFAAAALGELLGYTRVWRVGLGVFTVGSLACAFSPTLAILVASRVLQGFGAAMVMSIQPSVVRHIYPPKSLGQGTGWIALTVASTSAAGPTFGGALLAIAPWPWLFLINVPIGIALIFIGRHTVPNFPATGKRADFDLLGALFTALILGGFVLAVEAAAHGESAWMIVVFGAISLGAIPAFIYRERRAFRPILDLALFAKPKLPLTVLTSVCSFTGQGLGIVSLPYFFQTVLGRSPLEAGLMLTPWPISVAICAPFAGRLADKYPVWILTTCGLSTMATGAALLALLPQHPAVIDILWREVIFGVGFGFFQAPNNRELLSSIPRERSGAAGGLLSTARLFGQSLGVAGVAVIFGALGARAVAGGGANADAIAHALPAAMWTACAVALVGVSISAVRGKLHTAV